MSQLSDKYNSLKQRDQLRTYYNGLYEKTKLEQEQDQKLEPAIKYTDPNNKLTQLQEKYEYKTEKWRKQYY